MSQQPQEPGRRVPGPTPAAEPTIDTVLDATVGATTGASTDSAALPPEIAAQLRASKEHPGDRVGPYTLVRLLGEGGFGAVWHGERHEPYHQRVALKLIRAGMDSASVLVRFEQERQALALMDHPHVAKVLDGGVTQAGRPWFAMEFVDGQPITEYCDRHGLSVPDRLSLFLQVCDAVQHAHMRGLIHRDLKPGNILVADVDGAGAVAKVIDFGIAKALSVRPQDGVAHTLHGQMIGTPEYMSPEQALPGAEDIDTRTDVYSLGVVLYELLVGATPFDATELRAHGLHEIQRTLRDVDPPSPSARLTTMTRGDDGLRDRVEQARRSRVEELARELRTELELIPLKAMRKERQERYASAQELAMDVRRYLEGRPLVAAPESRAYRAKKWAKRHRGVVVGAGLVLASLVVGLVVSLLGWREAGAQRDEAQRRERDAARVLEFMTGTLARANPMAGGDAAVSLSDALLDAVTRLDEGELADHAESEAALRLEIARVFRGQGNAQRAAALAGQAAEAFARLEGVESASTAAALTEQGLALLDLADAQAARALLERALAINEAAMGMDHPDLVANVVNLALVLDALGDVERAIALHRRALTIARAGQGQELIATCLANLGDALAQTGQLDEADPLLVDALAMRTTLLGGHHPDVAEVQHNLALLRWQRGARVEADQLFNRALTTYLQSYGPAHADAVTVVESLVELHLEWERVEPGRGHAAAAEAFRNQLDAAKDPQR